MKLLKNLTKTAIEKAQKCDYFLSKNQSNPIKCAPKYDCKIKLCLFKGRLCVCWLYLFTHKSSSYIQRFLLSKQNYLKLHRLEV